MSKIFSSKLSNKRYTVRHGKEYNNIKINNKYSTSNDSNDRYNTIDVLSYHGDYSSQYFRLQFDEGSKEVLINIINNYVLTTVGLYSTYTVSGDVITITVNKDSSYYNTVNNCLNYASD